MPGHEIAGVVAEVVAEVAAPLLCAGTYSPLRHWEAGPGKRAAVVGLGGLGHMAVRLAHAMGADVTVPSQSLRKQDDGLRLGADAYSAASDDATFAELTSRFDLIVNTVSAGIDVGRVLMLLSGRRAPRRARSARARRACCARACAGCARGGSRRCGR